jgi:hypothetical protein
VGTEDQARNDLKPFFDLDPVVVVTENIPFSSVPSVVLNGVTDASCNTSETLNSIHTVNVRQWSADTFSSVFDEFDAYLKQYPDARTSAIIMETFSTAASTAIPDNATAYPWRDSKGYL